MPRITPLRVVLTPVALYVFGVWLWVVLPFPPSVHGDNYGHYHRDVLRAGRRLTTVYENKAMTYVPEDDNVSRDFFAVDWQLVRDVEHNSLFLNVGMDTKINLTGYADTAVAPSFVDRRPVLVTARAGDTDGVMLPWFPDADAALLNWEIEGDMKLFRAVVVVPEPGVVQVWPHDDRLYEEPLRLPGPHDPVKVFVTVSDIPTNGDRTDTSRVQIDDMTWNAPSFTFPIRRSILIALKPITLNVVAPVIEHLFLFAGIFCNILGMIFMITAVGAMVTYIRWLVAGRPPFESFARGFWLSAWLYERPPRRVIYGPAGPVEEDENIDGSGQEQTLRLIGPQPLSGVLSFFQSRSPLDDLCVTFESTRWLVEPIRQPRVRSRFEPSDGITDTDLEKGPIKIGY